MTINKETRTIRTYEFISGNYAWKVDLCTHHSKKSQFEKHMASCEGKTIVKMTDKRETLDVLACLECHRIDSEAKDFESPMDQMYQDLGYHDPQCPDCGSYNACSCI
jgi:hypothetical protein